MLAQLDLRTCIVQDPILLDLGCRLSNPDYACTYKIDVDSARLIELRMIPDDANGAALISCLAGFASLACEAAGKSYSQCSLNLVTY